MKRREYVKTGAAVAGLTGLAGCFGLGGGAGFDKSIGVIAPLSGPLTPIGKSIEQGAKVARDELSDDVSVRIEDGAGTVEDSLGIAKEMVNDGTPLLTGPLSSDVCLAVRSNVEKNEGVFVPVGGSSPKLTQSGTKRTFRYIGDSAQFVVGSLQYWQRERDVSGIALLGANYTFPHSIEAAYEQYASQYDAELRQATFAPLSADNFKPEINKIDDDRIDAISIAFPGKGGIILTQQLREAGMFDTNIVQGDLSFGTRAYINATGQDALGAFNWSVDVEQEKTKEVASTIEERFGARADSFNIIAYDVVKLQAKAIQESDGLDSESLAATVRDMDYQGASGWSTGFDENGYNRKYRTMVNQWVQQNGSIQMDVAFRSDELDLT